MNSLNTESRILAPGSTIGIIGGGQLGRMMSMAASRMGYHVHIFTPEKDSPAAEVSLQATVAEYTDEAALKAFAKTVDVVTFEFENIPTKSLELLASEVPVHPSPQLLHMTQNRVREKEFCKSLGIGTAPFAKVDSLEDLEAAISAIGVPSILKTSEMGYDGKGQVKITSAADAKSAWEQVGGQPSVLEGFVDFVMEVSVIVARNADGDCKAYPLAQNIHENQILKETLVPAMVADEVEERAENIALKIANETGLVGLLAVEMFVTRKDKVLVNEMAPRPHNSGHWSMDAAVTGQFEQAIRAVCNLPLGSTGMLCPARMLNLIGDEVNDWPHFLTEYLAARLHLYGKREVRPGRKMGHVTILQDGE